ncbi:MGH1-like glycoside hydrolase domain-containing protein [Cerasicoccus fimbriatus]|uniref:MGH1-like glycoside hydrolase domain-containing protein n=1 Tax=Cerasicoccus fimbriatus TaxID=3014554 RepID=UPI0022B49816|nr:trehalase family glycosidase [Cerasicoccus sp. TK19100]
MNNQSRGRYFSKKHYQPEELPKFSEERHRLPSPTLEGNPEWVAMYWKAWEIAFTRLKKPKPCSPFVSNWIDEGLSVDGVDECLYQWDTIFMVMFARYGHSVFPAIQSMDNFYCRQHDDGLIWRVIREDDGSDHWWGGGENFARAINPPLFAWAEVESFKLTGDKSRFEMVIPVLEKYAEWIEAHRKSDVHGLYWNNGQGCGYDNTPRDEGRIGDPNQHSATDPQGWVDFSAQMVIQYNELAAMCDELDRDEQAKNFRKLARQIADKINQWCWNPETGLYHDVDVEGKQTSWKTIAAFWPLLARIADSEKQEALIKNLRDPGQFWRPTIFPSLAADQPYYDPTGNYWRGGVWAPTNYMVIKGLEACGHESFARECSIRYLETLSTVFQETGTLWEMYAPDAHAPGTTEKKGKICCPDFVGWTGCGPIALLIENVLGLRADGVRRTLTWHLNREDRHGIDELPVGSSNVSVMCEAADNSDRRKLTVCCTDQLTLAVKASDREQTFDLKAGNHEIIFN